ATGGDGFGLSRPFRPLPHLRRDRRRLRPLCSTNAPCWAGQLGTNTSRGGDGLDCCSEEPPVGARRFAANAAIAVAASSARDSSTSVAASSREISPDAVDVSRFDEAKQVASVAEEERRIIEAERQ